ncbi:neurotrophin 1-like isoform X2 [Penaeus indicus]|uniref:neurotrophin 1-like isoform X2 n=1 Tax=Penaeus indicus TaxID=29960 RepID=UPI00300CA315
MLRVYFVVVAWACMTSADPGADPRADRNPQPTKVVLGQSTPEEDSKTAHLTVPGPVGVSLGVGVPVPPLPVEVHVTSPTRPFGLPGPSRPGCGASEKYCLINSDYPLDKVNAIIDRYYNNVLHLYNDLYRFPPHDIMYHDNRTHGYRHGGHFVCESAVQYVRPGWAQNIRGEWVAVINTDKYPQSVRVESCKYQGKRCEFLPPCYKSKCVQRNTYVKLLSVDPYRPEYKPTVDVFEIPSACSCFVEDFIYY